MRTATIFVNDAVWLHDAPCLGVRFDTQVLPSRCWVAAFLVYDDHGVTNVISGGAYMSPPNDVNAVIAYAMTVFRAAPDEEIQEPEGLL